MIGSWTVSPEVFTTAIGAVLTLIVAVWAMWEVYTSKTTRWVDHTEVSGAKQDDEVRQRLEDLGYLD